MNHDIHHEETFVHKSGKKYNVRWYYDHDMDSPLYESDGHGVVEEIDWNPTDDEQLEQHLMDFEPELEEETRLRMMRRLTYRGRSDNDLYYDVLSSLHLARTEWGHKNPDDAMAAVEQDFKYLKGWYEDDWFWLTLSVAPLDADDEIDEDHREYCGGYESTVLDNDSTEWREELIEDMIHQVEHTIRKELHKGQLELALT